MVNKPKARYNKWFTNIYVNGIPVKARIDTGAETNLISYHNFCKLNLNSNDIQPTKDHLNTLTKEKLEVMGGSILHFNFKKKCFKSKFHVVNFSCLTLIGLELSDQMGLINIVHCVESKSSNWQKLVKKHKSSFNGIGCVEDTKIHLETDPNVKPINDPPRKVPLKIRSELKKHLNELIERKIIDRVRHHTP